jgi:hypothetical protein
MPKTERSRRPVPRPEADESTTRAATPIMRPRMRPDDLMERAERRKAEDSADAAYRASRREAEDMDMQKYEDGGSVLTTRRMPSGAQQYVRESEEMAPWAVSTPTTRRLKTVDDIFRATRNRNPEARGRLTDAFIDESMSSATSARTERQALDEDRANRRADRRGAKKFADGGMVRGCKPAQMSGKGFKGTF